MAVSGLPAAMAEPRKRSALLLELFLFLSPFLSLYVEEVVEGKEEEGGLL
jgi:hypothetical protein